MVRIFRVLVLLLAFPLQAFAQTPPGPGPGPGPGHPPPFAPPPGYPPPGGFPPPPPPPTQVVVLQRPVAAPESAPPAALPTPVAPIGPMKAPQDEVDDVAPATTSARTHVESSSVAPVTQRASIADVPATPRSTTPVTASDAAAAKPASKSNAAIWALGFIVALLAWWIAHARSRRLGDEKRQLAQRQRRLQSEHVQLRAESERLRQLAVNDPLTGTLNRLAFTNQLRERLDYLSRFGRPLDLVVFDLDHFKQVNDRLGHLAGDAALKLAAGIVREHLDSDDLFGRFGGDEFLIACADQGTDAVARMADAIRVALVQRAPEQAPPMPGLSLSMGIAQANATFGYDADDLFARADTALYRAKREGRNRVVVSDGGREMPEDALVADRHL